MSLYIKKCILILLELLICISCSTNASRDSASGKDFNTTITIHYKEEADKKYTKFQQYDKFFLNTNGIIDAPAHITENEKLKTTIKLNLNGPWLLLLGFTEFYIEPNNNLDIDFTVLKQTKTEYVDSIKINHGTAIIVRNSWGRVFLNRLFVSQLRNLSNRVEIEDVVSEKYLVLLSTKSINKLYSLYPEVKESKTIRDYFQEYFKQYFFSELCIHLNVLKENMRGEATAFSLSQFKKLSVKLSNDLTIKVRPYWFGMNKIFEQIINPEFKKFDYSYESIKPIIKDYDAVTQQYFFLLSLKEEYNLEDDNKQRNILRHKNITELTRYIAYPEFVPYIEKFKSGNNTEEFINDNIKKSILHDYNNQQIVFNDLFTKSSHRYILLDFCGSWCKPCMEELKEYKISPKLDTSSIVRPIWIFFENDDKDWLNVIKTYDLKKENCFLLQGDTTIQKNFGILFSWRGEFPHRFLFN